MPKGGRRFCWTHVVVSDMEIKVSTAQPGAEERSRTAMQGEGGDGL